MTVKTPTGAYGTQRRSNPLTPAEREHYEERAAIIEYCGGLSRRDAETQAAKAVSAARKAKGTTSYTCGD